MRLKQNKLRNAFRHAAIMALAAVCLLSNNYAQGKEKMPVLNTKALSEVCPHRISPDGTLVAVAVSPPQTSQAPRQVEMCIFDLTKRTVILREKMVGPVGFSADSKQLLCVKAEETGKALIANVPVHLVQETSKLTTKVWDRSSGKFTSFEDKYPPAGFSGDDKIVYTETVSPEDMAKSGMQLQAEIAKLKEEFKDIANLSEEEVKAKAPERYRQFKERAEKLNNSTSTTLTPPLIIRSLTDPGKVNRINFPAQGGSLSLGQTISATADGQHLAVAVTMNGATAGQSVSIRVLNKDGRQIGYVVGLQGLDSFQFSPDGAKIATLYDQLRFWDDQKSKLLWQANVATTLLTLGGGPYQNLSVSDHYVAAIVDQIHRNPDRTMRTTFSGVQVFDANNGNLVKSLPFASGRVRALQLTPDNKLVLIFGRSPCSGEVHDLNNGKVEQFDIKVAANR